MNNDNKLNNNQNNNFQKTLDEHMNENNKSKKSSINIKNIFTYGLLSAIVIVCILLLVHFCSQSVKDLGNNKTTTTSKYELVTNTNNYVRTSEVSYVTTSRLQTAATHTYIPGNQKYTNTSTNTRNSTAYIKSTRTTTVSTTTTQTTTETVTTQATQSTQDPSNTGE